jgi:transcriptional regulator with XRE-family HTH domain
MELGEKIKRVRHLKGLTQKQVAKALGMTQAAYSMIEKGKIKVTKERLQQIAEVLNIDPIIIMNIDRLFVA